MLNYFNRKAKVQKKGKKSLASTQKMAPQCSKLMNKYDKDKFISYDANE